MNGIMIGPELHDLSNITKIEIYPDGRTIIYTPDVELIKQELENYEEGYSTNGWYTVVQD